MMNSLDIEKLVSDLIRQISLGELLNNALGDFISLENDCNTNNVSIMKATWNSIPNDMLMPALVHYLKLTSMESSMTISRLFFLLERLLNENYYSVRQMTDAILNCEKFNLNNPEFFRSCYHLLHKMLDSLDYKGNREVFNKSIEKLMKFPVVNDLKTRRLLMAPVKLIRSLLNRDSCLMPAYFAMHELIKHFSPTSKIKPHPLLERDIFNFMKGFNRPAKLLLSKYRSDMTAIVGVTSHSNHNFRLDAATLSLNSQYGAMRLPESYNAPQYALLEKLFVQPGSQELIHTVVGLTNDANIKKVRINGIDTILANFIVKALERIETDDGDLTLLSFTLERVTEVLIHFMITMSVKLSCVINLMVEQMKDREWPKSRKYVMWFALNASVGFLSKNMLSDFLPILSLYDILYMNSSDEEMNALLSQEDINFSEHLDFAAVSVWKQLLWKNKISDNESLPRMLPPALKVMSDILDNQLELFKEKTPSNEEDIMRLVVALNAHSAEVDVCLRQVNQLLESFWGSSNSSNSSFELPYSLSGVGLTSPLPTRIFDSMTIHQRMLFNRAFFTKMSSNKFCTLNEATSPAIIESFARLLISNSVDCSEMQMFIGHLSHLSSKHVTQDANSPSSSLALFYIYMDILGYRLVDFINADLLCTTHKTLSSIQLTEFDISSVLVLFDWLVVKLSMRFLSPDVIYKSFSNLVNLSRNKEKESQSSHIIYDSEELNKFFFLSLMQSYIVYELEEQPGVKVFLIEQLRTLHSLRIQFQDNSLRNRYFIHPACVDPSLQEIISTVTSGYQMFGMQQSSNNDLEILITTVEKLYHENWRNKSADNEFEYLKELFSANNGQQSFFLCCVIERIKDNESLVTANNILMKESPRSLDIALRTLCDYLFASIIVGKRENIYWTARFTSVNYFVPFDRLVFFMLMRSYSDKRYHEWFPSLINELFKHNPTFKESMEYLNQTCNSEFWNTDSWPSILLCLHQKYPDMQIPLCNAGSVPQPSVFPIYYNHSLLRIIPILQLVLVKILSSDIFGEFIRYISPILKFLRSPLTFLYTTFKQNYSLLMNSELKKRQLVYYVLQSRIAETENEDSGNDLRCASCYITREIWDSFVDGIDKHSHGEWKPTSKYFCSLLSRMVDTFDSFSEKGLGYADWCKTDYPSRQTHVVYVTALEVMLLPLPAHQATDWFMKTISDESLICQDRFGDYVNSLAILFSTLPRVYLNALRDYCASIIEDPLYSNNTVEFTQNFFEWENPPMNRHFNEPRLSVWHVMWLHVNSVSQLTSLAGYFHDFIGPKVVTEAQFLLACHLVGPIMVRLHHEKANKLMELATEIYNMLEQVDRNCSTLYHIDTITDLLYHIKYMHVGNGISEAVSKILPRLRPQLQRRLKFIVSPREMHGSAADQTVS